MLYAKDYNCRREHYLRKYKDAEYINPDTSEDIYKVDKKQLNEEIKSFLSDKYGLKIISFTESEDTVIDYTTNALKCQEKVLIQNGMLKNAIDYYIKYDYILKEENKYTIFYILYKSFEKFSDYTTKNVLLPKMLYTTNIIRDVLGHDIELETKIVSLETNGYTKEHQFQINNVNLNYDFKPTDLNKYYPLFYKDTEEPNPTYSRKCKKCGFRDYCKVPKLSIADLESTPHCWRTLDPIIKLHNNLNLEELTSTEIEKLTNRQKAKYYAYMNEETFIQKDEIITFLNKLFDKGYISFDFETYSSILPFSDKYQCYAQIPFSYSLDIVNTNNKVAHHFDYVTDYKEINFDKLIEQLIVDMPDNLPLVVYYSSFEKMRFKELQELYPQYSDTIQKWIDNIVDLYDIFNEGYYYDLKFGNSLSLKSVYPTLCDNKYNELEINKGDKAAINYKMIFNEKDSKDADRIVEELRKYNSQDTMAQVEIIEKLKEVVKYEN